MKNCNVVISLLFGFFVAGVSRNCQDVCDDGGVCTEVCTRYVTSTNWEAADAITFLWAKTFDLGFYAPAFFPCLICFLVTTVETVGDIRATYEASMLDTDTEEYATSIQGGLLADGVWSFFAALATSMPNTTFSQNNGVIALTKCASRWAGVACGAWLLFFGIIAKTSGIITSIPDAVIGGMTTFLFCNVFVSGIKVVSAVDLDSRRNRMILAISMGIGIGVAIVPYIFEDFRASTYTSSFWPCQDCNEEMRAVRNGILIILATPYCIGTILAMFLNMILPTDPEVEIVGDDDDDLDKPSTSA
jgi:NCS2 family nucleobase:cation symporter-2